MIRIELAPMLINPRLSELLKSTPIASFFIGDSDWNCQPNFRDGAPFASRYPIGLQFLPPPRTHRAGPNGQRDRDLSALWDRSLFHHLVRLTEKHRPVGRAFQGGVPHGGNRPAAEGDTSDEAAEIHGPANR